MSYKRSWSESRETPDNKMSYQLLIFDWDGTLMDSEARIVACMETAAEDLRLEKPDKDAIRDIIGLGLEEAIGRLFPDCHPKTRQRLAKRYRHHFLASDTTPAPLFAGVTTMLRDLKQRGHWLAVATGKGRAGLQKVLHDTGLEQMFLTTRCAGDTASKPNPQMLFELLEETGVEARQALMIGDTEYDLQMAQNASMTALAVGYGVHEKERLLRHEPIACVDDVAALHDWLLTNGGRS